MTQGLGAEGIESSSFGLYLAGIQHSVRCPNFFKLIYERPCMSWKGDSWSRDGVVLHVLCNYGYVQTRGAGRPGKLQYDTGWLVGVDGTAAMFLLCLVVAHLAGPHVYVRPSWPG